MTLRATINVPGVPAPTGYSHLVVLRLRDGDLLFASGQIGTDQMGNVVGKGDIAAQCEQTLVNLRMALREAGARLEDVIQTRTFATDLTEIARLRDIRAAAFGDDPPSSTTVQVVALFHPDAMIEMDAVAFVPRGEIG
jgi:enamine deaminase RidA (YjgF/YER057c/UK114 family)